MRQFIIAAGIAALSATSVSAQQTCEERRDGRRVGTVAGAGVGAVLGGVIGGNALGAVLGAVGGGVAGNQLTRSSADCVHAYGYYDNGGRWHANRIDATSATGFYDRDGRWVTGAPAGSYDRDGRWVASDASRGYRDRNGYWVASGAQGYYAGDGTYVTAQPVYADNRGYQQGYNGQQGYNQQGYTQPGVGNGDQRDFRVRIQRINDRIDQAYADGTMSQVEVRRAKNDLHNVNLQAGRMPHYRGGGLSAVNARIINDRLDTINGRIRATRDEARNERSNY